MNIKAIPLFILLTSILILSVIIGYLYPPSGIMYTPVVLSIMIWLVTFTNNGLNILAKTIISYLCIGLNDIGIKLFAGGAHDWEGQGWIHMLLFIGLVPCSIMLAIGIFRDHKSTIWFKVLNILLFGLLIYLHLEIFKTFGITTNFN